MGVGRGLMEVNSFGALKGNEEEEGGSIWGKNFQKVHERFRCHVRFVKNVFFFF